MFRESNVWWQNNNIKDRTLITVIHFHICALYYAGCDAKVLVCVEQLRLSADHIMNTNKIHHGILTPRLNTVLTLLLNFNNRPTTYSLGCAFCCCCIDAIIDICSMKLTWLSLNWSYEVNNVTDSFNGLCRHLVASILVMCDLVHITLKMHSFCNTFEMVVESNLYLLLAIKYQITSFKC